MPRGIDLHIPFPSRISPDAEVAHARHLDWPCSFGLLDDEPARQRHVGARYAELAARFNPLATGADLDLSVDQMSWFFVFDDLFDGPQGDPGPARELVDATTSVLDQPPGPDAEPIVRAFADLWRRSQEGMAPSWRTRAARHWRGYLAGYLDEADNRRSARRLSLPKHLQVRRRTSGVRSTLDLAERCGHFEVPDRIFASEHLTAMCDAVNDITIIQNDLCSLEKEVAIGELNNTVLILEREHECAQGRAIEMAVELTTRRLEAYLALEQKLPTSCRDFDPAEREAVERYVTDGLRAVVRGCYDWSETTGRYAPADLLSLPRSG